MFDYDIYWINCSENKVRYEHMKSLLEREFPNNKHYHVEAIMHKPKYNGITMAHMVAIMKGMTLGKPFLVVEDDITVGEEQHYPCKSRPILGEKGGVETDSGWKTGCEKPDAIYLGLSYWGNMKMGRKKLLADCMEKDEKVVLINNKVFMKKGARGEDWDDNFFRIRDMYGAHAILYISKSYMMETLKICILAISMNKPHDIYLHKLQKKYLVFGQKYPWFYQLGKIGGQETGTNIDFSGIRKIMSEKI
jgi:hypothetical protein